MIKASKAKHLSGVSIFVYNPSRGNVQSKGRRRGEVGREGRTDGMKEGSGRGTDGRTKGGKEEKEGWMERSQRRKGANSSRK